MLFITLGYYDDPAGQTGEDSCGISTPDGQTNMQIEALADQAVATMGTAPAWIDASDPDVATALAGYYSVPCGVPAGWGQPDDSKVSTDSPVASTGALSVQRKGRLVMVTVDPGMSKQQRARLRKQFGSNGVVVRDRA